MKLIGSDAKAPPLGALEIAVLRVIWAGGAPLEARAVLDGLAPRRISLSTVQATLERLHRKALLARTKRGRAFVYSAAVSRESLIGALIRNVANRLADGDLEPVISGFVEILGDSNPELLDELRATVAKRGRGPK